jgi:Holliday junction resolvasome RuvABC endonuclease subunit
VSIAGKMMTFDFATCTGFAKGEPGEMPSFGHHVFDTTGTDLGEHLGAIEDWLAHTLSVEKPVLVGYEQPSIFGLTTPQTVVKLCCYGPVLEKLCHRRRGLRIPVRQINPSQVKKFWTGKGNARKPDMVARAKKLGFDVSVDDEADGLACWFFMLHCYGDDEQKRRFEQMRYEADFGRQQKAAF